MFDNLEEGEGEEGARKRRRRRRYPSDGILIGNLRDIQFEFVAMMLQLLCNQKLTSETTDENNWTEMAISQERGKHLGKEGREDELEWKQGEGEAVKRWIDEDKGGGKESRVCREESGPLTRFCWRIGIGITCKMKCLPGQRIGEGEVE